MCLSHLLYAVRPRHVLTMSFFSRPWHSTAFKRRPVGYLPAFAFFRLPRGVPRRFLPEAYQSSSQWSIPMTVNCGSSTLHKQQSVKLLDYQLRYFRLQRGLSRRTRHCWSMAGVRQGMCELTNGMAGERHGHGTLSVYRPLVSPPMMTSRSDCRSLLRLSWRCWHTNWLESAFAHDSTRCVRVTQWSHNWLSYWRFPDPARSAIPP